MKKITTAVLCCFALVLAADIEIKDSINKSKIGAANISGWTVNRAAKDLGKGEIIQGSEKDEKAFKVTTNANAVAYYRMPGIAAKAGDKIEISLDVKAKKPGKFYLGFYSYTAKGGYFESVKGIKAFDITETMQEVKAEFVIQNGAKGQVTGIVRPYFKADANNEVIIEDLEIEIDKED